MLSEPEQSIWSIFQELMSWLTLLQILKPLEIKFGKNLHNNATLNVDCYQINNFFYFIFFIYFSFL
jgi:hypothetical protein